MSLGLRRTHISEYFSATSGLFVHCLDLFIKMELKEAPQFARPWPWGWGEPPSVPWHSSLFCSPSSAGGSLLAILWLPKIHGVWRIFSNPGSHRECFAYVLVEIRRVMEASRKVDELTFNRDSYPLESAVLAPTPASLPLRGPLCSPFFWLFPSFSTSDKRQTFRDNRALSAFMSKMRNLVSLRVNRPSLLPPLLPPAQGFSPTPRTSC